ncbi:hypothetical protein MTAT_19450 [Moorella thermoacetica]|uniref:Uncharacterized protein n=2 Tax=Neomoorella thermoacetica TaxID=1525 RepID=A0AAC9MVN5_NEOTH|nr:hypothetical protein [Moorella thermoacetica]AOQ24602.1 hypothetical protein Maut_02172 [Moorella thermoacetica]TYL12703.1 hypothetical protein MTAT_19450 [Moorella thermoacetica]
MYKLHCILIKLAPEELEYLHNPDNEDDVSVEDIKIWVRERAVEATEHYEQKVFDYRSEDSAGRWSEKFPDEGVVLGFQEPQRFRQLLQEYSQIPLQKALHILKSSLYYDYAVRTKEEITADRELVIIDKPSYEVSKYWSARKAPEAIITEQYLINAWQQWDDISFVRDLSLALRLISGEYTFDSCFYSVADGGARIAPVTMADAMAHPSQYALVFSDYHF